MYGPPRRRCGRPCSGWSGLRPGGHRPADRQHADLRGRSAGQPARWVWPERSGSAGPASPWAITSARELTAEKFIDDPFRGSRGARIVPQRRPGALARRRPAGASGAARRAGQDPRLSDRTGRDRGGAGAAPGGVPVRGQPVGSGPATAAGRLRGVAGGCGAAARRDARVPGSPVAGLHGAGVRDGAAGAAADPQREGGSAGLAGAGRGAAGTGPAFLAAESGVEKTRRDLARSAGGGADRRPR